MGDIWNVVLNGEEQYSVWPEGRELPAGWSKEGTTGTREQCLQHIGSVWKDIRPKSVRDALNRARS